MPWRKRAGHNSSDGGALANVISKSCDDEDAKEAAIEFFVEALRLSVEDLDEGHGYKIEMGMH